jgi:hypothetical protein
MPRRGRPPGSTSRLRNPVNYAAHHATVLMECWLAGSSIQIGPEYTDVLPSLLTTGRWLVQPKKRERTVPPKIKRLLCKLAIAHVVELDEQSRARAPELEDSARRSKAKAKAELKSRGWTDERIAAWFKKLQVASERRVRREFRVPTVNAVLAVVNRKAPESTLRRRASERISRRKMRAGGR